MASPQIEDGFTKVSNELLEALAMVQMSGSEWQYVMCLIRKTYGYNQKEAWVNNAYVAIVTGIPKQRVSEAKLRLIAKNIVTEKRDKISLNKDYESWGLSRKNGLTVTEKRVEMTRKSVSIKEKRKTIKEITEHGSEVTSKNMSFKNQRKYREDGHWEEKSIDVDSGEVILDEVDTEKEKEREMNESIRYNLHLVEEARGLPFGRGKNMAFHVKIYRELLQSGWSDETLISSFLELVASDYWKEKRLQGQYPGMNTLQSLLRNKKPI
jgi:phage replication O-like protein O